MTRLLRWGVKAKSFVLRNEQAISNWHARSPIHITGNAASARANKTTLTYMIWWGAARTTDLSTRCL
jgi:hypothetical protein